MASTRGTQYLSKQNVPFTLHTYDHQVKGAEFAAQATNIPIARMIKTLVVELSQGFVFALMPGDRTLSLKKLGRLAGSKVSQMSTPKDAERLTGYQVGGISPFGAKRALEVYLDQSLAGYDTVAINGGGRGTIVSLSTQDLIRLLHPTVADISE